MWARVIWTFLSNTGNKCCIKCQPSFMHFVCSGLFDTDTLHLLLNRHNLFSVIEDFLISGKASINLCRNLSSFFLASFCLRHFLQDEMYLSLLLLYICGYIALHLTLFYILYSIIPLYVAAIYIKELSSIYSWMKKPWEILLLLLLSTISHWVDWTRNDNDLSL